MKEKHVKAYREEDLKEMRECKEILERGLLIGLILVIILLIGYLCGYIGYYIVHFGIDGILCEALNWPGEVK